MSPQIQGLSVIDPLELKLPTNEQLSLPIHWWESFQNKELSTLIETSVSNNPSVALANTRIEKAQALAGLTRSTSMVQMGAGLDVDRQRFSQTGIYPAPLGGSVQTLTTLQLSGAWIPDVFGKHKAAYESAIGQVQASALEAEHAKTQLSSQIALQFIGLALSIDERELLQSRDQQLGQLRQLINERRKAGLDSDLELKAMDIESNDVSIQISQLNHQIQAYRFSLAALSGREPSAFEALTPHLNQLQALNIQTNIGTDLLGRRSDVVAAKTRVLASLKSVEAAQLDFYPNLNLGFFAGYNTLMISQLRDNASAQYGIVPSLSLPIFDGGRLNAQLSSKSAEKDQAVAIYNSTLLEALKEASEALSAMKSAKQEQKKAQNSMRLAKERLSIQAQNFNSGLIGQTALLRESLASLQMQRIQTQYLAKQLNAEVLLLKALGANSSDSVIEVRKMATHNDNAHSIK